MNDVERIAAHLDKLLGIERFSDDSNNGLQVANSGRVDKVCAGVDASLPFFEAARAQGAGMLLCHHGLSWGDSLRHITGLNYRLVSYLIQHDMALWACHLPLDAHPRYGNNAQLAVSLGLKRRKPFCEYHGQLIGIRGELDKPVAWDRFKKRLARETGSEPRVMDFGPQCVQRIGVVSGGAAAEVAEAAREGLDAYVSGEATLQGFNLAQQLGMNAAFAGHYATERYGVKALLGVVAEQFGVETAFVPLDVPY